MAHHVHDVTLEPENYTTPWDVTPVAGVPVTIATPAGAADWVCDTAISGVAGDVHLANAYTIAISDSDESFRSVLLSSMRNFPDGKPLAWVTRLSKQPLRQVRGPELFGRVMDEGRSRGLRHFLLGGTDETLNGLVAELVRRYPGVVIAGTYSPAFHALTDDDIERQDAAIRASGSHIVWVGLGTPKQDFEAARLAESTNSFAVAVGAAFDFVAGTKREAPSWMTGIGLEWFYRLVTEPRRLWWRYLFGNLQFIRALIRRRQ